MRNSIFITAAFFCMLLSEGVNALEKSKVLHSLVNFALKENKGQVTDQHFIPRTDIQFQINQDNFNIFIGSGELHYQWTETKTGTVENRQRFDFSDYKEPSKTIFHRIDVKLLNCNKNAEIIKEGTSNDYDIYYNEQSPIEGLTCHSYQKVTYKNIYPGIDWVLYTAEGHFKYDFVVHTGAQPSQIHIQYNGTESLHLNEGKIFASNSVGSIVEDKPYSYIQETDKTIPSEFILNNNVFSFKTVDYIGTLVIDPSISWSTYYGGNNNDVSESVFTDPVGNVIINGHTSSTNNIATTGSYQDSASLGRDAFVAKFTNTGTRLWGTFLGGKKDEYSFDGTCDSIGAIYIVGKCSDSTPIIAPSLHQSKFGGGSSDGFIVKFTSSGQKLWGSYYGGANSDEIAEVDLDNNGRLLICGTTNSADSIGTPLTHKQSITSASSDAFVAKFDTSGVRIWGTYFGGTGPESGISICHDPSNNIFISGSSLTSTGIATNGAYQVQRSAMYDGIICKFDSTGQLLNSTYFGGNGTDFLLSIKSDHQGNVYVGGFTSSSDTISSSGAFKQNFIAGYPFYEGLLAKFSNSLAIKYWGTYYGDSSVATSYTPTTKVNNLNISDNGDIYIAGETTCRTFIATLGSFMPIYPPAASSGYLAVFNPSNGNRKYGTYFGGHHNTAIEGIAQYNNNIYITGQTSSDTAISIPGAFQTQLASGNGDGFLARFLPDTAITNIAVSGNSFCPSDSITIAWTTTGIFQNGNIFTIQLSDSSGSFSAPVTIGTLSATSSANTVCTIPANTFLASKYRVRILSSNPYFISDININNLTVKYIQPLVTISAVPGTTIAAGTNVTFTANVTNGGTAPGYQWLLNGVNISGATNSTYSNNGLNTNDTISLHITSNNICANPDSAFSNKLVMTILNSVYQQKSENNDILLYPNPNNGNFTIQGNDIHTLQIISLTGSILDEYHLSSTAKNRSSIQIDKHLPNGIYYVKLFSNQSVKIKEMIVQSRE